MRRTLLAAAGAAFLITAAPSLAASTPTFNGTVGPGFTITMAKKPTKAGKIKLVVADKSSIHNFHLTGPGVNVKTDVSRLGRRRSPSPSRRAPTASCATRTRAR